MTDPHDPLPPPQNLAVIKAITAGLGLLLVGGVALLGVLLVTRDAAPEPGAEIIAAQPASGGADYAVDLPLAAGERLVSASSGSGGVVLHIEDEEGAARVVVLHADGRTGQITLTP